MSSAYLISHVSIHDAAAYEGYKELSTLALQAYGAEICVRGGKVEVLEVTGRPNAWLL